MTDDAGPAPIADAVVRLDVAALREAVVGSLADLDPTQRALIARALAAQESRRVVALRRAIERVAASVAPEHRGG